MKIKIKSFTHRVLNDNLSLAEITLMFLVITGLSIIVMHAFAPGLFNKF